MVYLSHNLSVLPFFQFLCHCFNKWVKIVIKDLSYELAINIVIIVTSSTLVAVPAWC